MKKELLSTLLRLPATVFTFKEIYLTLGETNPALLKRRLHYYVQKGELYHIRRGIYAKDKHYDRREVATKIFTPAYISFETILREAGIIFQYYSTIFVATYQTKDIICDDYSYSFRKIKDTLLMNAAGIEDRGAYFAASKERAFLDVLYLNKEYHFDNLSALSFDKVYSLLPIYANKRMEKRVDTYFKAIKEEKDVG